MEGCECYEKSRETPGDRKLRNMGRTWDMGRTCGIWDDGKEKGAMGRTQGVWEGSRGHGKDQHRKDTGGLEGHVGHGKDTMGMGKSQGTWEGQREDAKGSKVERFGNMKPGQ